jgi:hypothetical protein
MVKSGIPVGILTKVKSDSLSLLIRSCSVLFQRVSKSDPPSNLNVSPSFLVGSKNVV